MQLNDDPPATLQNIGIIRPGFSAELDCSHRSLPTCPRMDRQPGKLERERTGIKTLKVGYNKVFGYYIEITHSNTDQAPPEYIRKQTLVNAERYITPEMKEYETLVLNAEERIHEIEVRLFKQVCNQLAASSARPDGNSSQSGRIGCARIPGRNRCSHTATRSPKLMSDSVLEIHEGRHPVVEAAFW